jgi:Xaa-Pro aminopeptidase
MNRLRVENLLVALSSHDLTGFIILPGPNLRYLTGVGLKSFERTAFLAGNHSAQLAMVVPKLDEEKITRLTNPPKAFAYTDTEGPNSAVQQCLQYLRLESGMVGLEASVPWRFIDALQTNSGLGFMDISPILSELRIVKDARELESLRKASQLLETAMRAVIYSIQSGMTEDEVSARIVYEGRKLGAEEIPFCAVQSGANSAIPHFEHSSKRIERGDAVVIDVGAVVEGYYADITRTVFVGEYSQKQREVYETVRKAQTNAIVKSGPGVAAQDIDRAARQIIDRAGFGKFFVHRTGHGLGLDVHEPPFIREGNQELVHPGMVFTVEPGIYLPGEFGIRIEDNIVINDTRNENLTTLPKEPTVV